jgi:hypothetical protein
MVYPTASHSATGQRARQRPIWGLPIFRVQAQNDDPDRGEPAKGPAQPRGPVGNLDPRLLAFLGILLGVGLIIILIAILGSLDDEDENGDQDAEDLVEETYYPLGDERYRGEDFALHYPDEWRVVEESAQSVMFGSTAGQAQEDPIDTEYRDFDSDDVAVQVGRLDTAQTPEEIVQERFELLYAETPAGSAEVITEEINGHEAARMRLLGAARRDFEGELLLAIEVDEQVFLFTGYGPPTEAEELIDLLVRMAASSAARVSIPGR